MNGILNQALIVYIIFYYLDTFFLKAYNKTIIITITSIFLVITNRKICLLLFHILICHYQIPHIYIQNVPDIMKSGNI